jgi:hypothetical protein
MAEGYRPPAVSGRSSPSRRVVVGIAVTHGAGPPLGIYGFAFSDDNRVARTKCRPATGRSRTI